MPKLERLSWIAPLSEGRGVTLTDNPEADLFLAENPNALLLGVLLDSQFATKLAFASPLRLHQRLGHIDFVRIAAEEEGVLVEVFARKPALHRFPNKFARTTLVLAQVVTEQYGGDAARIWQEAGSVDELGRRIKALPAFGIDKTNWTVGMLGTLGLLPYDGWQEYRVPGTKPPPS